MECDFRFGARIRLSTAGFTDETAQIWIENSVLYNGRGRGSTIPVVDKAKYLGSILDREPGHEADVDARTASASSAFAKLKPLVFKNKNISIEAKRAAYVACVLTILLYGSLYIDMGV